MSNVGIKGDVQRESVGVLAAILHLGNVQFEAESTSDEYATIKDATVMKRASSLLGCEDVGPLVLNRTMKVPGAVYNIQLTPPQAAAARNALAKAIYCLLFDWVRRLILSF